MPGWDEEERATLVALLRSRPGGMGWTEIIERVGGKGSARLVWDELFPATLFGGNGPEGERDSARRAVAGWRGGAFSFTTFLDEDYPGRLRGVRQAPPVVFYAGTLRPGEQAVSVVGSRAADPAALEFAGVLARLLVARGLTVASGLAAGVDAAAHRAALDAGGRTVAVIGTGIRRQYPPEHRALQDEIARRGLVLSQFWPDAAPTRQSFPMRNATMSAYGYATVVVAAGEHSGTRVQAREAVAHGRAVILTERVVDAAQWARRLVGQPGVYVAGSPQQAAGHVDHILMLEERIAQLLDLPAGSGF
jgi:DNA processing protein